MKYMLIALLATMLSLSGCNSTQADVVSQNISLEAGEFKINRRVVFLNGITDKYILVIEGRCQVDHADKLSVTCKVAENDFRKHYLGLSDNVTYFAEQLSPADVNTFRYKVLFKPETILPDIDMKTSASTTP